MQEKVSGSAAYQPSIIVQHNADQMSVGLGLEQDSSKPDHHLIDQIYGDNLIQIKIGKRLIDKLSSEIEWGLKLPDFLDNDMQDDFYCRIGRITLDSVTGSTPFNSQFTWLDRPGVNRLIRLLRKARDVSFGRDE